MALKTEGPSQDSSASAKAMEVVKLPVISELALRAFLNVGARFCLYALTRQPSGNPVKFLEKKFGWGYNLGIDTFYVILKLYSALAASPNNQIQCIKAYCSYGLACLLSRA